MLHVGLDMHKRFSVVTVIGDDGKDLVSGKRLDHQDGEIRRFCRRTRGRGAGRPGSWAELVLVV